MTRTTLLVLVGFVAGYLGGCVGMAAHDSHAQSAEVATAIAVAAQEHGVSEWCLRRIAWRESRFDPWANNFQGSGAAGLMQFMPRLWQWAAPQAGYSPVLALRYDASAAARVAAWVIAHPWTGGLRHWGGYC
jgi:soluble lytic murein transglycosylase-like protein